MLRAVIFLLIVFILRFHAIGQEPYNDCSNAIELCPNEVFTLSNIAANATFCGGCEDDFNICFTTENTVWASFTTNNLGGDVQINVFNLSFETNPNQGSALQATIIETTVPCNAPSYTAVGNCVPNAVGDFALNAAGLAPNTTYYIVFDGDNSGAGVTESAECSFDVTITGTAVNRPVPSAQITPSNFSVCNNEIIYFGVDLVNCPDSTAFKWFVNGVLEAVTDEPEFSIASIKDGDIVSVENSCFTECVKVVSSTTLPITVNTTVVSAGPDKVINMGEAAVLNGITSASSFIWTPSFYVSDVAAISPSVEPLVTTTYTLTATENGCTEADYVTVTVLDDLDIPNTFSPNGDDINDTWVIKGIENYPNSLLNIYDRWGQEVFKTTGYSKSKAWDGKIKSGESAEGVYFYILNLDIDGGGLYKGSITVVR